MSLTFDDLEIYKYNDDSLSVKDLLHDIELSDSKWNFIFESILKNTNEYYFLGDRLDYKDDNLESTLNSVSDQTFFSSALYHIMLKVKPSTFLGNRVLLSKLWAYYEYPAIIFLNSIEDEQKLLSLCKKEGSTYKEIAGSIGYVYIIHRNFEPNVLWIEKGSEAPSICTFSERKDL